ncbi:hypothetical protein EYC80_006680 [Monilinia laxa]|uniref:Wax synthase domain-containing protein n=1 Tax=Monilinia laxa TaxID=61186 RepID=A0A5N6JYX2_MONLA|nr:hypothetical protein EYC80_006680 [Monilinia laxa]
MSEMFKVCDLMLLVVICAVFQSGSGVVQSNSHLVFRATLYLKHPTLLDPAQQKSTHQPPKMNTTTPLTHPLLLFLSNRLLTTATAAYTHSPPLRLLALSLSISLTYLALSTFHQHIRTPGWASSTLAGASFGVPNMLFDRLIARNWLYENDDIEPVIPGAKQGTEKRKRSRWEWGKEVVGNTRYIGTTHEVSHVPFFHTQDLVFGPSRWAFCLRHAVVIVACFVLNMLMVDGQLGADRELLGDEYIAWFGRMVGGDTIQPGEIRSRVTFSVLYWGAQICFLQYFFSMAALLDVGLGGGEVRLWRPLFGELSDTYTIRGLWGKFWHQGIQLSIKGPAEYLTHSILHLPHHTLLSRYLKVFLAFAVSGAMHTAADYGGNISLGESGAMRFFCTQALGIMIEDGVQEVWKRMGGRKGREFRGKKRGHDLDLGVCLLV